MVRRIVGQDGGLKWVKLAEDIKNRIAAGEFTRNEIITATELAVQYNTSRQTMRDALYALAGQNILTARGTAGFEVAPAPDGPEVPEDERPAVTPLGKRLRALRKEHRWNVQTLGEKARVSPATIRMIETDYRGHAGKAANSTLARLSRALQCPDDYLAELAGNPGGPSRVAPPETASLAEITSQLAGLINHSGKIEDRLDALDAALERLEAKIDWIRGHSRVREKGKK